MKSLYYKFIYRHLMRFAHKHDWHKMERNPHLEAGKIHLWCHWCGARSVIIDPAIVRTGKWMDEDKGYKISTHEKQAEFAKNRNYHYTNTDNPIDFPKEDK